MLKKSMAGGHAILSCSAVPMSRRFGLPALAPVAVLECGDLSPLWQSVYWPRPGSLLPLSQERRIASWVSWTSRRQAALCGSSSALESGDQPPHSKRNMAYLRKRVIVSMVSDSASPFASNENRMDRLPDSSCQRPSAPGGFRRVIRLAARLFRRSVPFSY